MLSPFFLLLVALAVSVSAYQRNVARVSSIRPFQKAQIQSSLESRFKRTPPILHSSASSSIVAQGSSPDSLQQRLKIGSLFGLWYALNIGYNVYNKKVLNLVPQLTYTVAFLQLFLGLFYVLPVWGLGIRAAPELTAEEWKSQFPIAILHTLTHLGAVVSLGAGAVSFTHIVKAAEPAVSAAISATLGSFMPWPVYASLIPVMGGVAFASAKELSFTWLSFGAAMISNIASAMRGIVGKKTLGKPIGKNMNAANVYGIMTILSTIICLPICLAIEGKNLIPTWKAVSAAGNGKELLVQALLSGFFYYLYNEVAFLALDNVAPVTHAIGNTIKRVVIIIASVVVFKTPMSMQGIIGSTIAILGVLLYSLAKNAYK